MHYVSVKEEENLDECYESKSGNGMRYYQYIT